MLIELKQRNIEVVVHMIVGFKNESFEDTMGTAKYIANLGISGIKIHMLHVLRNSPLAKEYYEEPFYILSQKEYIYIVTEILKIMPKDIVIHRLTGDGSKENLIAPLWTLNKKKVLNDMHKYFEDNL